MSKLTLKKYGADWCGPCRMLSPIIKNLEKTLKDVDVVDIDIDNPPNEELKALTTIRAIPVIIISRDDVELKRFTGFQTEETIKAAINALL